MKKMNALFTALTLVITAVTPMASSAASATKDSKSQITLSRTYNSHYTIHIPDENPTLNADKVEVGFGVTGYLEYNEKLTVSVISNNGWQLKDSNTENENGVEYKMKVGEKVITSEDNDVVSITSADNNNKVDTPLTFCDFGEAIYAGTYGDTLTFEVRTESIPNDEVITTTTTTEANTPEAPVQEDTDTETTTAT